MSYNVWCRFYHIFQTFWFARTLIARWIFQLELDYPRLSNYYKMLRRKIPEYLQCCCWCGSHCFRYCQTNKSWHHAIAVACFIYSRQTKSAYVIMSLTSSDRCISLPPNCYILPGLGRLSFLHSSILCPLWFSRHNSFDIIKFYKRGDSTLLAALLLFSPLWSWIYIFL